MNMRYLAVAERPVLGPSESREVDPLQNEQPMRIEMHGRVQENDSRNTRLEILIIYIQIRRHYINKELIDLDFETEFNKSQNNKI